jgi:DNA polymerase-3 subunit epsilon
MRLSLFIDSETTDKSNFALPYSDPCQPDIVQFCGLLMDEKERRHGSFEFAVRPVDKKISAEAARVHGLSAELLAKIGMSRAVALRVFANFAKLADEYVAHNIDFDLGVVRTACHREKLEAITNLTLRAGATFCTKEMGTPIMKLPPTRASAPDYKWPKLDELHRFLFGKDFEGAHGALADCEACARCYFEIKRKYPDWHLMPRRP